MRRAVPAADHTARPRAAYCLPGWIIASLSLLLAIGLICFSAFTLLLPAGTAAAEPRGAVVLLTASGQNAGQYRLLKAGLASAGFLTIDVVLDQPSADSPANVIQDKINELGGTAPPIWLTAVSDAAPLAWRTAVSLNGVTGIVLIEPHGLAELSDSDLRAWPSGCGTAIFTSSDSAAKQESRQLFEKITGTGTSLFPAFRASPIDPWQYASADGLTWLQIYDGSAADWLMLSPRIMPDIVAWLQAWTGSTGAQHTPAADDSGHTLLLLIFSLLIAGILLLAVPAGISLGRLGSPDLIPHPEPAGDPMRRSARQILAACLIWLPAALPAATLGLALALLAGSPDAWLLPSVLLLPGCRGWLHFAGKRIGRRRQQNRSGDFDAGQLPGLGSSGRPFPRSCRLGLIMLTLAIAASVIWIILTFGYLQTGVLSWIALPILLVISLPAGLAGTVGVTGEALDQGLSPTLPWPQTIWQHLPFLILPIWTASTGGWNGLLAGLLLLAIELWSVSVGKAAVLLCGRPGVGSLFQTLAWMTAAVLPAITQSAVFMQV